MFYQKPIQYCVSFDFKGSFFKVYPLKSGGISAIFTSELIRKTL